VKRIFPLLSLLGFVGFIVMPAQQTSKKQSEVLAKAAIICIHVSAEKHIACLNKA
jgi:hypothetical protein